MRDLFSVNKDGVVEVAAQAWLLAPFAEVKKKYKDIGIAVIELGVVYFAADYRSNFLSVNNDIDRVETIKKQVYSNRNLKIDDITFNAISFYKKNQNTVKIRLIRAVNSALEKAIDTIEASSIADLDEIKQLADLSAKLPGMIENLEALEKFVKKEVKMEEGVVGSGSKSSYEDDN